MGSIHPFVTLLSLFLRKQCAAWLSQRTAVACALPPPPAACSCAYVLSASAGLPALSRRVDSELSGKQGTEKILLACEAVGNTVGVLLRLSDFCIAQSSEVRGSSRVNPLETDTLEKIPKLFTRCFYVRQALY